MPRNTNHLRVRYKGRFVIRKDQISSDISSKFINQCMKKKTVGVKTSMTVHNDHFHIGHKSGLRQVNYRRYFYSYIKGYYIFASYPKAVVFICREETEFFMFLVIFESEVTVDELVTKIEATDKGGQSNEYSQNNDAFENEENLDMLDAGNDYSLELQPSHVSTEEDDGVDRDIDDFISPIEIDDEFQKPNEETDEEPTKLNSPTNVVVLREYVARNNMPTDAHLDNYHNSHYEDLFANKENLPQVEVDDELDTDVMKRKDVDVINGSTFMYSQSIYVGVMDLGGSCESDEDV